VINESCDARFQLLARRTQRLAMRGDDQLLCSENKAEQNAAAEIGCRGAFG